MKTKPGKFTCNLFSVGLGLVAFCAAFCTWAPFFYPSILTVITNINSSPRNNGYQMPMRVAGINYPITAIIGAGIALVISLLLLLLLAKQRKTSAGWFWANGLSAVVIISHFVMWVLMLYPFV